MGSGEAGDQGKLGSDKWNSFRIKKGQEDVTYFREREFSVVSGDKEQVREEQLVTQEPTPHTEGAGE